MAKLKVTPELIAAVLLPGESVSIVGASFDKWTRTIELEIEGAAVPKVPRVQCVVHEQAAMDVGGARVRTFEFKEIPE